MKHDCTQIKKLPDSVMIFGCGYVGTALARALQARGVCVGALTRNSGKAEELRSYGLSEVVEAELHNRHWHDQLQGRYSAVVNCVSSAGGGIEGYRKSYLQGQRSILEWAKGMRLDSYLYTSSTSVYPQDGGVCVDENSSTVAAPETGQVLLESECLLEQAAELFQHYYVFRLAGLYGPGRHYLLDQLRTGESVIPGSGDYHLNLIHRDDVVSAIMLALSPDCRAASGVYNLADDNAATKKELVHWLARRLGLNEPRFDPDATSPRVRRRGGRMPDRIIENHKAKEAFSWSPRYKEYREAYDVLLSD